MTLFAKLFPVKSPLISTEKSVGVDFFVPENSQEFIDEICKSNDFRAELKDRVTTFYKNTKENSTVLEESICCINETGLHVYKDMIIPTGICINLPENVFLDVRPKSSCMKKGYHVIYGTCDEDYTYGIGVQVEPKKDNFCFSLEFGEKFAQFILLEKTHIYDGVECSLREFNALKSVRIKRGFRTGGFGSTGKQ